MSVINNTLTEIGDSIIIKTKNPLVGINSVLTFEDSVENETLNRFFIKTFRYSIDSIVYSDWFSLTNENLEQISLLYTQIIDFEFRYERGGTEETGVLIFNSIKLEGQLSESVVPPSSFKENKISQFVDYDSGASLYWAINVAQKIKEGESIYNYVDKKGQDFSDFWLSITRFWGLLVAFVRTIVAVFDNINVLRNFLNARGIYFNEQNTLEELTYLVKNIFLEYKKRGTVSIFGKKNNNEIVDGEFLRIIEFKQGDEFFFNYLTSPKTNWFLDVFSPLYRGRTGFLSLNRAYENTEYVEYFDKYPVFQVQELEDGYIKIDPSTFSEDPNILDKLIMIESSIDYELTMFIKAESQQDTFSFGCYMYDEDLNRIDSLDSETGYYKNDFLRQEVVRVNNEDIFLRTIIFKSGKETPTNTKPNIGFGNNLVFQERAKYIVPFVFVDNSSSNLEPTPIYFRGLKVTPLSFSYDFAFLNASDTIELLFNNNSNQYDKNALNQILTTELLPHNVVPIVTEFEQDKRSNDIKSEEAYLQYLEYLEDIEAEFDESSLDILKSYFDEIYSKGIEKYATHILRPFAWKVGEIIPIKGTSFIFTRASAGSYLSRENVLEFATNNQVRINWFNNKPYLLLEKITINLLLRTQEFDNAYWSIQAIQSRTPNAAIAPDGTMTATLIIPDTSTDKHGISRGNVFTVDGNPHSWSIYVKSAGYRYIVFGEGSIVDNSLIFDVLTGAYTQNGAAPFYTSLLNPIDAGNGWWRIGYVTDLSSIFYDNFTLFVTNQPTGNNAAWAANGSDGILLWGAQLEQSEEPTSYINSDSSQITRNADYLSKVSDKLFGSNFGSLIIMLKSEFGINQNIFSLLLEDDTPVCHLRITSSNNLQFLDAQNSNTVIGSLVMPVSEINTYCISWQGNKVSIYSQDESEEITVSNFGYIKKIVSTNNFVGLIEKLDFMNTRITYENFKFMYF